MSSHMTAPKSVIESHPKLLLTSIEAFSSAQNFCGVAFAATPQRLAFASMRACRCCLIVCWLVGNIKRNNTTINVAFLVKRHLNICLITKVPQHSRILPVWAIDIFSHLSVCRLVPNSLMQMCSHTLFCWLHSAKLTIYEPSAAVTFSVSATQRWLGF